MSGTDGTLRGMRASYDRDQLIEADALRDPMAQFQRWIDEAIAAALPEPNAMTLASVDAQGSPSARIVLLRGLDARGFAFYTNYESRKGRELDANPRAALVFYWAQLHRQVRVEGSVVRMSAAESDAYFASRPRGHRLSAWASRQSATIAGREVLEAYLRAFEERFAEREVERPPYWGGYRLVPAAIEFWQGRLNRTHDRLRYTRDATEWTIERLAP